MPKKLLFVLTISCLHAFAGGNLSFLNNGNKNPKYGMLGFSFIAARPLGGGGHLFDDKGTDKPHGEFGLAGGFDYWKRYLRTYDIHIGLEAKYQQYHFHYGVNDFDGYFRFMHLSIPITMQFPFKNYPYIFVKAGVALSSLNILSNNSGSIKNNSYIAEFQTAWPIYPEIILGIDFLEEQGKKAYVRVGIDFTFVPISSMATYDAFVSNNVIISKGTGTFTPNKVQLKIVVYPKWKKRKFDLSVCPEGG